MKSVRKSVLLIDNDFSEILNFQKYLLEISLENSLLTASSYKEGFDILCGNTFRVKPSVLIVNVEIEKSSAIEFLRLIRSYYSFRNLKIFVLHEGSGVTEKEMDNLDVTAVLRKPLDFNNITEHSALSGYTLLISSLI